VANCACGERDVVNSRRQLLGNCSVSVAFVDTITTHVNSLWVAYEIRIPPVINIAHAYTPNLRLIWYFVVSYIVIAVYFKSLSVVHWVKINCSIVIPPAYYIAHAVTLTLYVQVDGKLTEQDHFTFSSGQYDKQYDCITYNDKDGLEVDYCLTVNVNISHAVCVEICVSNPLQVQVNVPDCECFSNPGASATEALEL
jgi:hypothetical protein